MSGKRMAVAALASVLAAAAVGSARADAASTHPVIVSVVASPKLLDRSGGAVTVRVQVRGAKSCKFEGQRFAAGPFAPGRTLSCGAGSVSARLAVAANPYSAPSKIHFRVTARDSAGHAVVKTVTVAQRAAATPPAPKPAPALVVSTTTLPSATLGTPYTATLTASGGTKPYIWTTVGSTVPGGLTLTPTTGVIAGTPTAAGVFTFAVDVTDSAGRITTTNLTLAVAGPAVVPPSTPPPPTAAPTYSSSNWSGYFLEGGPYTGITGTFNVPTAYAGSAASSTSEWVGIDGTSSSNPGIIQAGVAEDYSPTSNKVAYYCWIELYPAPAALVPVAAAPGNTFTVSIVQAGAGIWTVQVKNDTTGQSWMASEPYAGPASAAEWIVEAPSTREGVLPLASYSPVTFTQLGINPVVGALGRILMIQNGVTVSTPSALSPNGFSVAYGSVTPNAP